MWIAVLGALAGLVLVALLVVGFGIRSSRAASREQEQLSELTRQMERLLAAVSSLSMGELCKLIPEACDAALERVSHLPLESKGYERIASDEELERMELKRVLPFMNGLSIGEPMLPSRIFGEALTALRAIKFRYHTDAPKTFSREPAWVFGGKHDALRKRLLGLVSSSDDPIPVGQERPEQLQDIERKGGS